MVQTGKFPLKNVQIEFKILTIKPLTVHLSDEVGKKHSTRQFRRIFALETRKISRSNFPIPGKTPARVVVVHRSVGGYIFSILSFFSLSVSRSASHIRLVAAKEKILQTIMRSIEQWWLVGCLGGVKTWKKEGKLLLLRGRNISKRMGCWCGSIAVLPRFSFFFSFFFECWQAQENRIGMTDHTPPTQGRCFSGVRRMGGRNFTDKRVDRKT